MPDQYGEPTADEIVPTGLPEDSSTESSTGAEGTSFSDIGDEETKTLEETFAPSQFYWQLNLADLMRRELLANAEALGFSKQSIDSWFEINVGGLMDYMTNEVYPAFSEDIVDPGWVDSPWGQRTLEKFARNYLSGLDPSGTIHKLFNPNLAGVGGKRTTGRGGGTRRLTPEEIRQQFDLDQLASAVTDMYRGLLLDEPKNARAIASAYVESIVANPDQKLDFQTFVRNRLKKEPRYATMYRNKPRGMTEEQYMGPYLGQAMQMLRPRDVSAIVAAGVQLGGSPQQFRERLRRDNAVTSSAPFITEFENRLNDVKGIFRG